MKKIAHVLFFTALALSVGAQKKPVTDSAAYVVDRFLQIVNYDAIEADSLLYSESKLFNVHSTDTLRMLRWFSSQNKIRIELWRHDTLVVGFYSNERDKFRSYDLKTRQWEDLGVSDFFRKTKGYSYKNALSRWRDEKYKLTYKGVWRYEGRDTYRVHVQANDQYDRDYLFERQSGLLFLVDESDTYRKNLIDEPGMHPSWRAYHEYIPLGNVVKAALLTSKESYLYDGQVTVMASTYKYIPKNDGVFENDRR